MENYINKEYMERLKNMTDEEYEATLASNNHLTRDQFLEETAVLMMADEEEWEGRQKFYNVLIASIVRLYAEDEIMDLPTVYYEEFKSWVKAYDRLNMSDPELTDFYVKALKYRNHMGW